MLVCHALLSVGKGVLVSIDLQYKGQMGRQKDVNGSGEGVLHFRRFSTKKQKGVYVFPSWMWPAFVQRANHHTKKGVNIDVVSLLSDVLFQVRR